LTYVIETLIYYQSRYEVLRSTTGESDPLGELIFYWKGTFTYQTSTETMVSR